MDPITIAMIVSTVAPALGSLIGRALSAGDEAEANRLSQQAMDQYGDIIVPKLKEIQGTELNNVTTDPSLVRRQLGALDRFEQVAKEGGMTLSDKAALHEAMDEIAQRERANRGAIVQNFAERGMGGSGAELAAQLLSQQEGANRAAKVGEQQAAAAQQRALDAWEKQSNAAGALRSQEYGEKSAAARAQDEINKFNTQNAQRTFENQLALAGSKAGALNNQANVKRGQAANANQMWEGIGGSVGKGASVYGQRLEDQQAQEEERRRRAMSSPGGFTGASIGGGY